MRRMVLLASVSALAGSLAVAVPAMAQTGVGSGATATTGGTSTTATDQHSAQKIVDDSASALKQVESDQHFDALMKKAKGALILPNLVKGAAGIGGSGGQGVLVAHRNGRWSDPAFVSLGSISIGPQVGGKAGPVVMLLMTDKALNDVTEHNNFSFNANAELTIVNYSAQGQGSVGKGDIIVWSGASGAFAGANVSGSDVVANTRQNQHYYGKSHVTPREIIEGQVTNPAARSLRDALPA